MRSEPVLIIGASRGIGFRLAEIMVARGHKVLTISRSGIGPTGAAHIRADVVADGMPMDQLPDKLSGLAYCPGSIDLRPLRSITKDELMDHMRINVIGAFVAAQAAAERLKQVPGAGMVFFSTVAVGQGMSFHSAVAAAKGGVEGLSRALAAELAPAVRVNCIAPSLTDTPLAARLLNSEAKMKSASDRHPLKRVGSVDDVAGMAAYLLGEESPWITGQVIGVDGGMSRLR